MKDNEINNFNENYAFLFMEKPKRKRIKAVYRVKAKHPEERLREIEAERTDTYLIYDIDETPQTS